MRSTALAQFSSVQPYDNCNPTHRRQPTSFLFLRAAFSVTLFRDRVTKILSGLSDAIFQPTFGSPQPREGLGSRNIRPPDLGVISRQRPLFNDALGAGWAEDNLRNPAPSVLADSRCSPDHGCYQNRIRFLVKLGVRSVRSATDLSDFA